MSGMAGVLGLTIVRYLLCVSGPSRVKRSGSSIQMTKILSVTRCVVQKTEGRKYNVPSSYVIIHTYDHTVP